MAANGSQVCFRKGGGDDAHRNACKDPFPVNLHSDIHIFGKSFNHRKEACFTDNTDKLKKSYLPMTETAFYILLALNEPRHGYGISKFVSGLTKGRIKLGSGTVYGTLTKMQRDGIIAVYDDSDKRISYEITDTGKEILRSEIARVKQVCADAEAVEKGAFSSDTAPNISNGRLAADMI